MRFEYGFRKTPPHAHECPFCNQTAGCANQNCSPTESPLCPACWATVARMHPPVGVKIETRYPEFA